MNIFKEKPNSRDAYDKAEREVEAAKDFSNTRTGGTVEGGSYVSWTQEFYDHLSESVNKAERKLAKLKLQAHKEANKLNEEFDRLKRKAQEAETELSEFMENELGIHEEESEKDPSKETVAQ